jgi:hypothetical protein
MDKSLKICCEDNKLISKNLLSLERLMFKGKSQSKNCSRFSRKKRKLRRTRRITKKLRNGEIQDT